MSNEHDQGSQRLVDLMIDRATCGLSQSESDELQRLASLADEAELERLELTAAAFDLALLGDSMEEVPAGVRDQILLNAGEHFAVTHGPRRQAADATLNAARIAARRPAVGEQSKFTLREAGWIAALAACLLLMLTGWNPFGNVQSVGKSGGPVVDSSVAKSSEELLADLLDSAPADLIDLAWTPVHDEDARGRVVWSDLAQEGYMVFEGLDPNDPKISQYQLWIFDTDPGQEAPVDGGVFDIAENLRDGRVVIPIKPHVAIDKAVQFAVTVERPGGVYRSDRETIPVLASLKP